MCARGLFSTSLILLFSIVVPGEVMSVLRDTTNADDLAKRKEEARRKRRKKKTATSLVSSCFQGKSCLKKELKGITFDLCYEA